MLCRGGDSVLQGLLFESDPVYQPGKDGSGDLCQRVAVRDGCGVQCQLLDPLGRYVGNQSEGG